MAERSQVDPDLRRRYEQLLEAIAAVEQSLSLEPDFRASRMLHVLLLATARIPWEQARARVVRIPYREGACCFGAAELDRKEPKLEDPALREYSGKPDFETWLGDEYRRHADAHRHEENCKNARTHWTPGTTVK